MPPQQQQAVAFTETNLEADAAASGGDVAEVGVAGGSGVGISASSSSSSMWDVDTSSAGRAMESLPGTAVQVDHSIYLFAYLFWQGDGWFGCS